MKPDEVVARFRKAGITDILIIPCTELDYDARPRILISYKTFDRFMNAFKKKAKK